LFDRNKPANAILASAIATAIGSTTVFAQSDDVFEEIIVTATKRQATMQSIPVAVQAMTGESLRELGVSNFDEYIQYLPNVVQAGRGPGQSSIYIRGATTEQSAITVSSIQGSSPSVALYQDEQPVSFGGRNLDIYATDLERIEVLPGPQGTLFGASSQSGTVRLITNKPQHDTFQAGFAISYGIMTGGEDNASVEAYINMPLTNSLAARVAAFTDSAGGWIDNVSGTYPTSIEVINRNNISSSAAICTGDVTVDLPACGGIRATVATAENSTLVEKNFNDSSYRGARFGLSWDVNDDWNLLLQHTAQTLETDGVFEYDPNLSGEESVNRFAPSNNQDEFGLTTWTVTGRLAQLDVVYTGGFLDRDVFYTQDYTGYTHGGGYQSYYICTGGYSNSTQCFDPTKQYLGNTANQRLTNELRFSTDGANRWRVTAGLFFDQGETNSTGEFQYDGAVDAGFNVSSAPGTITTDGSSPPNSGNIVSTVDGVNNPFGRGPRTLFVNDFTREEDQVAVFGEFAFDLTDTLSISIGARYYDIDYEFTGSTGSSFGCKGSPVPCDGQSFDNRVSERLEALGSGNLTDFFTPAQAAIIQAGINDGSFFVEGLGADGVVNQSDTIVRATLSWQVNDEVLLFGGYSEGFRPQTVNRNAGQPAGNQTGVYQGYLVPAIAKTDELENFEIGVKGDFFNRRLRLNATAYSSKINDLQTSRFDPANIAFLVFIENVGDADVNGLDADFQWAVSDNWTISGAASFIDTELTTANPQLFEVVVPTGSELPFTPDFSGNIRARYDFPLVRFGADAYVMAGLVYTGDSKAGFIGDAYHVEDITNLTFGNGTGLSIVEEGGFFGTPLTGADLAAVTNPGFLGVDGNGDTRFKNARYVQDGYTLVNLSFGLHKDAWGAELFINNVTDERVMINVNSADYTPSVTTNRPRTIGLRFSHDFE
jgi:outer membrane receptor protein involved in Fe transport